MFLSLIVKVTRQCNLRCAYCADWRADTPPMSFEVVANLIGRAMRQDRAEEVNFIWHGGEPLLRGTEFYRKVVYIQDQLREGKRVMNSIQTNGVLLNRQWIDLLKEFNFHIGLSLDGPAELHDRHRLDASGAGSFESTMRAMRLLQDHDVPHGILIVVTDRTLQYGPDRMFEFLMSSGIKNVSFLPMRPEGHPDARYDADDYMSPERFTPYIQRIFDLWFDLDDPSVHIREFDSIIDMLLGLRPSVCTFGGDCIGANFGINPDGDAFHCDRYVADHGYNLGNILSVGFEEIWNSHKLKEMRQADNDRQKECRDCKWFSACRGGCPHDAYIAARSLRPTAHPCGHRMLIDHIYSRLCSELQGTSTASA